MCSYLEYINAGTAPLWRANDVKATCPMMVFFSRREANRRPAQTFRPDPRAGGAGRQGGADLLIYYKPGARQFLLTTRRVAHTLARRLRVRGGCFVGTTCSGTLTYNIAGSTACQAPPFPPSPPPPRATTGHRRLAAAQY